VTTLSQDADGAVVQIVGGAPVADPDPPVDLAPALVTLTGPSKVQRNGQVTLTATVLSESNTVVPDSPVTFQRRVDGDWETVRTTTTRTTGVARTHVRIRQSTTFRVRISGPVASSESMRIRVHRTQK
jgi:hypothetical protein